MKNTRIYLAVMAVAMLFVTSCKKETVNNLSFTARLETSSSDSKTTLDGTTLKWNHNSDQVRIYDATGAHDDFTAIAHPSHNNDRTCAELIPSENSQVELADPSNYTAIYPSSIASPTSSSVVTLPTVQASTSGELTGYPMYAQSDSKSLQFKNLCSVLKLSLTGGETISRIEVVTDKFINGTFTINSSTPSLEFDNSATDHTKMTTLTLSSPVTLSSTASYFYIYLPVQEYKYIKINVYNESGLVYAKAASITNGVTLERSKYHLLALSTPNAFDPSVLNGEFSVSSSKKVSFSKGNLLTVSYTPPSNSGSTRTSSGVYKFADNQYERKDANATDYDKWLFQWGRHQNSTTMNTCWKDHSETVRTGIFSSTTWNHTGSIQNGGDIDWQCLSQSEWDYLLRHFSRMSYYNKNRVLTSSGEANRCFTIGTVNGVHGMIIFPDVFYWPLDNKEPTQFGQMNYGSNWGGDNNNYDLEEWNILEGAGCVFLPTTGGIYNGNTNVNNNLNTQGHYWAKNTGNDPGSPNYLKITSSTTAFADNQTGDYSDFRAIRLVKEN